MTATASAPTIIEPRGASTNRWFVLVIACMAQFMVVLDATVVNVALPSIQRDLHSSFPTVQWVVNAYLLSFAILLATRRTARRHLRAPAHLPDRCHRVRGRQRRAVASPRTTRRCSSGGSFRAPARR